MARDLSLILVVDVECTCWPPPGNPPEGQSGEIIEIGLALVDVAGLQVLQTGNLLVRPQRSRVSDFCTQLTTLTQEQVDAGITFADACRTLKTQYNGMERTWASWGDFDRAQFERQCKATGVKYPFGRSHLNLKNLFALIHALPQELGMAEALQHAGLALEGTHHRGGDDAKNIAKLLIGLLRKCR